MTQAVHPADAAGRSPSSWTDRLPTDLRPLGGRAYAGRLDDGSEVAVKAVTVGSREEAGRMVEYLRRLAAYRHPNLVPIRGAEFREGRLWVISELDQGLPLQQLLRGTALPPSHVVAIGLDILNALQTLQQLGLSHGDLHPGNVHISPQGRARLGDYALRPRFRPDSPRLGWPDPRVDLTAAGSLFCAALGVAAQPGGRELEPAERVAPALVAAVRVMAEGGAGRFAGAALGLFEEAAGTRARPAQLERSRQELGARTGGRTAVVAPQALSEPPQPAPVRPPLPPPRRAVGAESRETVAGARVAPAATTTARGAGTVPRRRWQLPVLIGLAALLLLLLGGWALIRSTSEQVVTSSRCQDPTSR